MNTLEKELTETDLGRKTKRGYALDPADQSAACTKIFMLVATFFKISAIQLELTRPQLFGQLFSPGKPFENTSFVQFYDVNTVRIHYNQLK